MKKNLSQQICELCNIPYKKKYSYFVAKYPDRKNSEGVSKEVDGVLKLNFESPENFVKLLELKLKHSSFIIDTFNYPKDKTFVATALVDILSGITAYKVQEQKFIQAIHDYDGWVWG